MLETKKFEFTVVSPGETKEPWWDDEPATGWTVSLPHQCNDWHITERDGTNREQAIRDLQDFIREANEALDYVKYASL